MRVVGVGDCSDETRAGFIINIALSDGSADRVVVLTNLIDGVSVRESGSG